MDIFILRHGDANTATKKSLDDSKRSLSENGIKEIENVSGLFSKFEIKFEHIYSSPLKRAKQSAEIIARNQKKAKFVSLDQLKPEGSVEEICKVLSKQKEENTTLIVGHVPLLADLANNIISSGDLPHLSLKTGGLIKIKTLALVPQLRGELEWLLSPKLVRKISK
jgi:phosphohistidine phosphatase